MLSWAEHRIMLVGSQSNHGKMARSEHRVPGIKLRGESLFHPSSNGLDHHFPSYTLVQFSNDSVTADSSVWLELYRPYGSFPFGLKERFSVFPFTFAHKSSWDTTVLMRKPGSNQGVCFSLVSGARPSHQTNVNTHSGHVWGSALDAALELAWGWPQDFNPILTGNRGLGEWGKEGLKRKTRWKLIPQHSYFLFWRQDLEVV